MDPVDLLYVSIDTSTFLSLNSYTILYYFLPVNLFLFKNTM